MRMVLEAMELLAHVFCPTSHFGVERPFFFKGSGCACWLHVCSAVCFCLRVPLPMYSHLCAQL